MTDELLRPFRDKLRGRPPAARGADPPASAPEDAAPVDSIHIHEVRVGLFPEASPLHPGFVPGLERVRMTLDLGEGIRGGRGPLPAAGREAILGLCPRLAEHDCGAGDEIRLLLGLPAETSPPAPSGASTEEGLAVAHLVEHVAIELIVAVTGARRCSGVTCAHRDRPDRFDIFVESPDPLAGRAAAVLAAAIVRDLLLGRHGRFALHRRCRDLLATVSSSGVTVTVAEDATRALGCGLDEGLQVLEELARLGYFTVVPSVFLFSSATGVLFRRAAPGRTTLPT